MKEHPETGSTNGDHDRGHRPATGGPDRAFRDDRLLWPQLSVFGPTTYEARPHDARASQGNDRVSRGGVATLVRRPLSSEREQAVNGGDEQTSESSTGVLLDDPVLAELLRKADERLSGLEEARRAIRARERARRMQCAVRTAPTTLVVPAQPLVEPRRAWKTVARGAGVVAAAGVAAVAAYLAWPQPEEAPQQEQASAGIAQAQPASPASLVPEDDAVAGLVADSQVNVVAHATVPQVEIREAPEFGAAVTHTLDNPTENGGPLVFLTREVSDDGDWVKVDLPVRPNGTQGWVPRNLVRFTTHTFRIEVSVGQREFRLFRGGEQIMHSPVAIGAQDTPTPGGTFYIKELLKPPDPNTVYGPFAFGLSGFSNALENFAGGEGVIGIHGTDDPNAIGREVSHGCIRLSNDEIVKLVGLLPLGTPVDILA